MLFGQFNKGVGWGTQWEENQWSFVAIGTVAQISVQASHADGT